VTTPEDATPKKASLFSWKVILGILLILVIIGQFTGGTKSNNSSSSTTSTSSSSSTQKADTGTHMACEHWRINLANASVETLSEQIKHAQEVNKYASVSSNPEIVSTARSMTEAYINQDSQAYLTYATAFGNLCKAAGE
jgi:hypothetical protein